MALQQWVYLTSCLTKIVWICNEIGGFIMGLRMRKSIKICKGVRVNFSKSGTRGTYKIRTIPKAVLFSI